MHAQAHEAERKSTLAAANCACALACIYARLAYRTVAMMFLPSTWPRALRSGSRRLAPSEAVARGLPSLPPSRSRNAQPIAISRVSCTPRVRPANPSTALPPSMHKSGLPNRLEVRGLPLQTPRRAMCSSRSVSVILAQGPCYSSLYRSYVTRSSP